MTRPSRSRRRYSYDLGRQAFRSVDLETGEINWLSGEDSTRSSTTPLFPPETVPRSLGVVPRPHFSVPQVPRLPATANAPWSRRQRFALEVRDVRNPRVLLQRLGPRKPTFFRRYGDPREYPPVRADRQEQRRYQRRLQAELTRYSAFQHLRRCAGRYVRRQMMFVLGLAGPRKTLRQAGHGATSRRNEFSHYHCG